MSTISIDPDLGGRSAGDDGLGAVCRALSGHRAGYSLPGPLYLDESAFRADVSHIWQREWIFAGHAAELVDAGDYFTLDVGSYPLIVVRTDDGTVRALHNVCRHRGSIVCDAASGSARRRFVCPYHQWTYKLNGDLAGLPFKDGVKDGECVNGGMPAGFELKDHGLTKLRVAVLHGLVFASFSDSVEPLQDYLGPQVMPWQARPRTRRWRARRRARTTRCSRSTTGSGRARGSRIWPTIRDGRDGTSTGADTGCRAASR
jgi:phenylpropionate dioxygenase-like ring-hydroxylating dioxygenase large terminal subunit